MKKLTKMMIIVLSLIMIVGCFGLFAACGDDKLSTSPTPTPPEDTTNMATYAETTFINLPQVPANWIYEGSPAGKQTGDTNGLIGGVTSGYYISRKVWNEGAGNGSSDRAKAAVALVQHMTQSEKIVNSWCGVYSINPLKEEYQTNRNDESKLTNYAKDTLKLLKDFEGKMAPPIDARINQTAFGLLKAGTTTFDSNTTKAAIKTELAKVAAANLDGKALGKYVAPATMGTSKVSEIAKTVAADLTVFTQFGAPDWQVAPYTTALTGAMDADGKNILWGDDFGPSFTSVYNKVNISRMDMQATNAAKEAVALMWTTPANIPDVTFWFTDAQAAQFKNDANYVSVAEIQAVYGDFGSKTQTQFIDKYALPLVGIYEGVYMNEKVAAKVGLTGDALVINTWAKLEAAVAKVKAFNEGKPNADKISVFAQDASIEQQYLVEVAILAMGGLADYQVVPSTTTACPDSWADAFMLIAKMEKEGWFPTNYDSVSHQAVKDAFFANKALFMAEGSWSRGALK